MECNSLALKAAFIFKLGILFISVICPLEGAFKTQEYEITLCHFVVITK